MEPEAGAELGVVRRRKGEQGAEGNVSGKIS